MDGMALVCTSVCRSHVPALLSIPEKTENFYLDVGSHRGFCLDRDRNGTSDFWLFAGLFYEYLLQYCHTDLFSAVLHHH